MAVSIRYARALLAHATRRGEQHQVHDALRRLMRTLRSRPALGRVLADPLIAAEQKTRALILACGEGMPRALEDLLALVVRAGREEQLIFIGLDYIRLLNEQQRLTEVTVVTAWAINKGTEQAFVDHMERLTGGRVALRRRIDPAIVGGYILRWEGWRLDRSVRGALRNIEKQLTR